MAKVLQGIIATVVVGLTGYFVYSLTRLESKVVASQLVSVAGNTLGVGMGALLAYWFTSKLAHAQEKVVRENARIDLTHRLSEDFDSAEMTQFRSDADELLKKYRTEPLIEIHNTVGGREANCLWMIAHFFQRLSFLQRHDRLHDTAIPELLGEQFYWWHICVFRGRLTGVKRQLADDIELFRIWMDSHTTPAERQLWIDQAEADLRKRLLPTG
jgi:hypothetical protein